MGEKTIVISDAQVQRHASLEDVIQCVEDVWRWHGEKKVVMPAKITTDMSELGVHGWFNSMPAYLGPVGYGRNQGSRRIRGQSRKGAALYPFQYFTDKSA